MFVHICSKIYILIVNYALFPLVHYIMNVLKCVLCWSYALYFNSVDGPPCGPLATYCVDVRETLMKEPNYVGPSPTDRPSPNNLDMFSFLFWPVYKNKSVNYYPCRLYLKSLHHKSQCIFLFNEFIECYNKLTAIERVLA